MSASASDQTDLRNLKCAPSRGVPMPGDLAQNDFAPFPDHWTPTIIQAGALFVAIFQVVYLAVDSANAPQLAIWLHLLNIIIAVSGFASSLFAFGRIYGRMIALGGLATLMVSMTAIGILTGRSDWYYASTVLLTMGASALMPWEIGWQSALNVVALINALIYASYVADQSSILHCLMVVLGLSIAQTATMIGQSYRRQVEEARVAALAASKAKSEFLSSMSHEIRTPMNAVLGMADLLLETQTTEEQQRYLNVMIANGSSLLDLINDILDLARIESGRLQLDSTEFDLTDLIDNTISTFGLGAHTKGLEMMARIAPGVPDRLVGDPLRLRQVLINLIGNAVKFTKSGQIVLEVSRDPGGDGPADLNFSVSDTGIGIPANKLDSIFSSFTQADSSTTRQYGGTGLGLAIVQRLVRLMGGRIRVESEVGEGSKFAFTVRFGIAARVISPKTQVVLSLARQRVLVVDDNHINRLILREMIVSCGGEVTEAACGEEVIDALRKSAQTHQPYRIVLLDMRMPGMDGLEVAKRIRQEKLPSEPLILMLSSDDFKPQINRLHDLGLDAYLVKPITRRGLFEAINRVLTDANRSADKLPERAVPEMPAEQSEPAPATKILVADDSPDNRLLIAAYLRNEPCQVEYAADGQEAVDKFIAHPHDIIIMDIQMPNVDGLTATRMIRQWELAHGCIRTPIVALTASALLEDERRTRAAGCDLHISKPVKKRVLLDTIRNASLLRSAETAIAPSEALSESRVVKTQRCEPCSEG